MRVGGGGGENHRPPRGRITGFKTMPLTKGAGAGRGGWWWWWWWEGGSSRREGSIDNTISEPCCNRSVPELSKQVAVDKYLKPLNKWQRMST